MSFTRRYLCPTFLKKKQKHSYKAINRESVACQSEDGKKERKNAYGLQDSCFSKTNEAKEGISPPVSATPPIANPKV